MHIHDREGRRETHTHLGAYLHGQVLQKEMLSKPPKKAAVLSAHDTP